MGNCATQLLTSLSRIYMTKATKRKIFLFFSFFLFFWEGGGRKECNRWRRSDPPHPHIPQPHFLNHPPQKNPQGMGFVYMNVQELILRHNISPKRRKIVLLSIQIFVREGGTSGKNDAEKEEKAGIVRKEKRGTFPRLLREDECCPALELKLPVWRKGKKEKRRNRAKRDGETLEWRTWVVGEKKPH